MPVLTEAHLSRHHHPSQPSRLRNEVTVESSDNERSEFQVPDSQCIAPESQSDLQLEDATNNLDHDCERINREGSERLSTADEVAHSRHATLKENLPQAADLTFDAGLLVRPKYINKPVPSPFSTPNFHGKATQKLPPQLSTEVTSAVFSTPSPPELHKSASQDLSRGPTRQGQQDTFPEFSVFQGRSQDLIENQNLPLTVEMNAVTNAAPPTTNTTLVNEKIIPERSPIKPDHAAAGPPPGRGPKGKKPKKGRKPRTRRPQAAVTGPPRSEFTADQGSVASGNGHTRTEDHVGPTLQGNEATVANDGHGAPNRTPGVHNHEYCPASGHENVNDHLAAGQPHEGTLTRNLGGVVEASAGPTHVDLVGETASGVDSNMPPVFRAHNDDLSKRLGSHVNRYLDNSEVVMSGHDQAGNDAADPESCGHGSPHADAHENLSNSDVNLNMQEVHDQMNYTHEMPQPQDLSVRPDFPQLQAHAILLDAPTDSTLSHEFQQSVLRAKSSRGSSSRISKPRNKKRSNGPTASTASKNLGDGAANSSSLENEVILNMMAMCLRAGDSKARNIVDTKEKAHETAIASLHETIVQQNCLIQNLQSQNDSFRARVQKISESTTQLQKYVKGMEGDYARLKSQNDIHRNKSDKLVKGAVHELEQERLVLQHDLLQTLEVLNNSQRHMKNVMNDCFTQLAVSESKHQSVSEELHKVSAAYDAQKKKCSDLEEQILPMVQGIQNSLEENHRAMLEKAGNIQGSLNNGSAERERDIRVEECLDVIRSLRPVPVLTVNDIRKTEEMLQSMQESIGSNMGNIVQSMETIQDPTEGIQSYIRSQLGTLRADVLKYEEALQNCRKAEQSNDSLHQQLETLEEKCSKLEESLRSSQKDEKQVRAQYSHLKSELETWMDKACNHNTDPTQAEQETQNLRTQVESAKEDSREAQTELGRLQQRFTDQAKELATTKVTLKEKETAYHEEIHKLRQESNGQNDRLGELRTGKNKLADDLNHMGSKMSEMTSEVEKLRESDSQMRKELQKARSIAKEASSAVSELTAMRAQTVKKSKEAQAAIDEATSLSSQLSSLEKHMEKASAAHLSKEEDLKSVKADNTRLIDKITSLAREKELLKNRIDEQTATVSTLKNEINAANIIQEENSRSLQQLRIGADAKLKEKDQLKTQISADRSRLDKLETELDARDDAHRKDMDALKELQRRIDCLQEENQALSARLERSRANEVKLSEAQAAYSTEKGDMQLELVKSHTLLEGKERELQLALTEAIERSKLISEQHSEESDELKRRINQAEAGMRAAEKAAEHKTRELEAHKRTTLEKFEKLVQEARRPEKFREHASHEQPSTNIVVKDPRLHKSESVQAGGSQPHCPRSTTEVVVRNDDLLDSTVTKVRKKPIRLNTTVGKAEGMSHSHSARLPRASNAKNDHPHGHEEGGYQSSFINAQATDELGAYEMLDENGVSFIELAAEEYQGSQRTLTCSVDAFDHSMRAMTNSGKADSISSALSEALSSDELIDMGPLEQGTLQLSPGNDHRHQEVGKILRDNRPGEETPRRLSHNSLHGASSFSQDRPKSQANTGSRMLAPTDSTASSTRNRRPTTKTARVTPSRDVQFRLVGSGLPKSSSPDYVHRPMSSHKTYGNHGIASADHASSAPSETPRSNAKGTTMKRKGRGDRSQENEPSKRHRGSSQLGSSQSMSSSQPAQISQGQLQGPYMIPTPRNRHSKGISFHVHSRTELT
ncbi:hypothetical protein PMIN01_12447 [Paraphaeosphaeria minitans]|uniref:Uncharacterized protein n=1 Tax=Paraphaeosphaeria minitans TaxID=565426 RepID=A0A9P6G6T2_9PLEO|nr:hypothetical protein PMIN01_12447 [Paraphaeosphaeria minitans]